MAGFLAGALLVYHQFGGLDPRWTDRVTGAFIACLFIAIVAAVLTSVRHEKGQTASPAPRASEANIVCARTNQEMVADDPDDPHSGLSLALIATFHNQPLADVLIGTAETVTAVIVYETNEGHEYASTIKAAWLTDDDHFVGYVGFEVNSVRRLVIAKEGGPNNFFATECLSDTGKGAYLIPLYLHENPRSPIKETLCRARVTLTIDGRVSSRNYLFFLCLDPSQPVCVQDVG